MSNFKSYTITDQCFVKQVSGDYHYLDRSEAGQFVVRNLETGVDFFIAPVTDESETEWFAVFVSLENAEIKNDFVSGKISFYDVAAVSTWILIGKLNHDMAKIDAPRPVSFSDIQKYKKHLDYKENYRETKSINDRFLSTIHGRRTKTSA
jgi:hypothetical protein